MEVTQDAVEFDTNNEETQATRRKSSMNSRNSSILSAVSRRLSRMSMTSASRKSLSTGAVESTVTAVATVDTDDIPAEQPADKVDTDDSPGEQPADKVDTDDSPGEQTVDIWFVRHGESKNNKILKAAGGLGAILYPVRFSQDPLLTDAGIRGAQANGQRLQKAEVHFDLVFCSCMSRAMETAYYMLVETGLASTIHVAPHVSETPMYWAGIPIYENLPLPRKEQVKQLGIRHPAGLLQSLDWGLVGGLEGDNQDCLPPNGDLFLRWLYQQPLFRSLAHKDEVNIAVVTHSDFMRRDALSLSNHPANADVFSTRMLVLGREGAGEAPHLVLTNMEAWYLEKHAKKHSKLSEKLSRKQRRFERRRDRLNRKLAEVERTASKLQRLPEEAEADSVEAAKLAASREGGRRAKKAEKKANKLNLKLQKKEKKFQKKVEHITRQQDELAIGGEGGGTGQMGVEMDE